MHYDQTQWWNSLCEVPSFTSQTFDQFLLTMSQTPPLLCPAHSPGKHNCCGRDGWMWWAHLLFRPQCVWRGTTGPQCRERQIRLWLLMRVYHNDSTFLMHLSYKGLQKYTSREAARCIHRCLCINDVCHIHRSARLHVPVALCGSRSDRFKPVLSVSTATSLKVVAVAHSHWSKRCWSFWI